MVVGGGGGEVSFLKGLDEGETMLMLMLVIGDGDESGEERREERGRGRRGEVPAVAVFSSSLSFLSFVFF